MDTSQPNIKLYRSIELKEGDYVRVYPFGGWRYWTKKDVEDYNDPCDDKDPCWQKQEDQPEPKLYRASELKIGDVVKGPNDLDFGPWTELDDFKFAGVDLPLWQKQEDQPSVTISAVMSNEQLESIIVQGLGNLVVFAQNLDPQEPTDQSDFEFYIRQAQNIIMARLMWRKMKAAQDSQESQNSNDSLTS